MFVLGTEVLIVNVAADGTTTVRFEADGPRPALVFDAEFSAYDAELIADGVVRGVQATPIERLSTLAEVAAVGRQRLAVDRNAKRLTAVSLLLKLVMVEANHRLRAREIVALHCYEARKTLEDS